MNDKCGFVGTTISLCYEKAWLEHLVGEETKNMLKQKLYNMLRTNYRNVQSGEGWDVYEVF